MSIARSLSVWQKAHTLALESTRALGDPGPSSPTCLAFQLQRAALSVVLHLTEGAESDRAEHFIERINASLAAARELEYLLSFASELALISKSDHAKLEARADQVRRMLVGLRGTVQKRVRSSRARSSVVQRKAKNVADAESA